MKEVPSNFSFSDNTAVVGIQERQLVPCFTELSLLGETEKKAIIPMHDASSARVSPSQGFLNLGERGSSRFPDGVRN